ncbi:DUF1501 domain-containing protein [Paraburkholderia rhynchosiae]|uniref:Twin-arginine translocation pathway signal sequence domain-containing protein n=1 Tax=Paraburkholderia rhynchosiae TaxID=487049 RepID=A0A2N7WD57_9BURK|nr:DUF1501 domain-containing protein [Paraburkholderia rhynchosiae]PMS27346.1 Twin-arginine translocation pathway signal sequence domain-containing protein [Paraburkholderia rhynchosiae]CAB3717052.1 hypothetical protein LMG27174_04631 [Paraburkholderia rhynchosiae]
MKRRRFLSMSAAAGAALWLPGTVGAHLAAQPAARTATHIPALRRYYGNLLILIELKGGNDGLNTVIPFADPAYYRLRKNIGIKSEQAIQLDERTALHPSLEPLMPLWQSRQLAIVQGVGYPQPNLSHFRSIEIWDTASRSDQYLRDGWLTRAFTEARARTGFGFAAEGVVIGSAEMGPLANGDRAMALVSHAPIFDVIDVGMAQQAGRPHPIEGPLRFKTVFPYGAFGASIETAMRILAAGATPQAKAERNDGFAAIRLTLNGFDTHRNQPDRHHSLLKQLADGLAAMRSALIELGRWNDTLVMTYGEFGRHPRENDSHGTDHGTVAPHFMMGGRVRGGLHGVPPELGRLDGNGNLPMAVDFRQLYATVLAPWWGLDASAILRQRFEPLPLLRV